MSVAQAAAPPVVAIREALARRSTIDLLRLGLLAVWIAATLVLATAYGALSTARQVLQTVGRDAAPSITAAQSARALFANLDANAANMLLGTPEQFRAARQEYERSRDEAVRELLKAAENITYGDAERGPILVMLTQSSAYLELLGQAQALHDGNPDAALVPYRVATALMRERILPAADALAGVNRDQLERQYGLQRGRGIAALIGFVLGGALLLAALVALQVFLARRMRRLLNPPLVVATLLALGYLWPTVGTLIAAERELRLAKQDAFDSLSTLWRARALAYEANGDESRYLLDRANKDAHAQAFVDKAGRLLAGAEIDAVVAAGTIGRPVPGGGLLADELNNITFAGEREAALRAVQAWARYVALDGEIRRLAEAGALRAAIDLCVGSAEGQSNWAFDQFDRALADTIQVNQTAFDQAIERGISSLAGGQVATPAVALAIAVLAWWGLRPRLAEYQA